MKPELTKADAKDVLFEIRGPDDNGCVWIYPSSGAKVFGFNMGQKNLVIQRLKQWLTKVETGD